MRDKICVVTGANSGIGLVTARELARQGATVLMVCRSRSKGEQARAAIQAATGSERVELFLADFASLESVRRAAAAIQARAGRLDLLVNNAGAYIHERLLSQEGYELTFAVNHLAPFLLTHLLLDQLRAGAPARIVNVASVAHAAGRVDLETIHTRQRYSGGAAYADSKLCNVLFTYELARRLEGSGVTANALHPGAVATNFALDSGGLMGLIFRTVRPLLRTAEQGARTSIYLASSPEVAGVSGRYFVDCKARRSSRASRDVGLQRGLWAMSEALAGVGAAVPQPRG